FTPVLADNGGFTPTVALKSDKLSDGTSIRFPRLENVLTDQRGVERFDSTCMGAYEMRCNAVDTVLKDTVMVGDSYTFIDKNLDDVCQKVGSYHFTETLKTVEGCDSIVKLSLAVRPQKNENGYYVKEDGTGDGSDWNNAMSPKDFAEYLPLVYDGETFHIAAGTYKSTYVDPELGRMYNINSSVTLIGGYPDTVTSTSTPSMPDVYVTKLTADVNGNDYTYYYPNSLEYTPYSNVKDNDSILIRVNGAKTLNLFGMTLSGVKSCDRGAVDLADGASLVMDRCFVQDNVASGVYGKGVDVKVTNSVFTHNYSNNGAAFNLVDSKLNVQSTAVYENRAKVEECESEYAMGGVANLENTEATFENSTLSNNAADMGSVFSVKSSKLDLTNNTIVGNQIIPESKHKGSFIGSLDDKSSVSLFGNIVIGNQNGEFDGVVNVASSDYNVFSYKTDMSYGSHDMVMNDPKEVQMLLDGDFAFESETVFIPNIQYNGGYTPTVAVIQSAFDGGKILNIPLDDRKVTYDQRGFVRKDSSCIGAFEFPTFMGYYVKKQAHGDGSGRDWENSMNDTTFAKYFPIVPTNASFHVAEGVYSPMFDSYGRLTDSKSRRYSSSRPVNIYGGYPDSAQTGCVADPVKYKTVLSVDYNGDDKYVESESDYSYADALNTLDNGYGIINISSKIPGLIEINGVEFRGQRCVPRASSAAVQIFGYNVSGVNTRIEKCSFVGNYAAIYSGCDTTIIEECLFDSLDYSGLSVSSFSLSENNYLLVDKTTFANSLYQLSASSFRGLMRVQNSTFANALYGVTTPLDFMSTPENTKIEIYNNSFFSGKKGDCSLLVYDYIPVELKGNIISSK
ncbi:MAG: right-handed parallel beta-helix repeat-containing protein, partial [Paludibacteraceae bacterium]|nr:right-handed parallel beta-helix repeat-containing protein [Paludibacteraceae bacterium]